MPRVLLSPGFFGKSDDKAAVDIVPAAETCVFQRRSAGAFWSRLGEEERALADDELLVGFASYEAAAGLEPSLGLPDPPLPFPCAWFVRGRMAEKVLLDGLADPPVVQGPSAQQRSDSSRSYVAKVGDIRERISAGDFFQANLSRRQTALFDAAPGRLIDRLPWPWAMTARFGALIDMGRHSIISASPELFLEKRGRQIASEPIKGTRPRASDPERDANILRQLIEDPKDRAENIMIVDLLRNDLAKVCEDGSIREPLICAPRSLPSVHHLVSRVEGTLQEGRSFADALAAAFPCGSVTGAPKLAAMRAIAELEEEGRGPYCGAIFVIGREIATASVAIRTALVDEALRRVDVRSGGGVTILSDPEAEYFETVDKAYLYRLLAGEL